MSEYSKLEQGLTHEQQRNKYEYSYSDTLKIYMSMQLRAGTGGFIEHIKQGELTIQYSRKLFYVNITICQFHK